MSIGEIVFFVSIILICLALFSKWATYAFKTEDDYNKDLYNRLKDDFLIDSESGVSFNVEDIGKPIHEHTTIINENNSIYNRSTQFDESFQNREEIMLLLKSQNFKTLSLNSKQIAILDNTKMLSKYDEWSFNRSFELGSGKIVLFPQVQYQGRNSFNDYQVLFWITISSIKAHYFLRQKETIEQVFDLIRNDDEFQFGNFEVFSIKSTKNNFQLKKCLDGLETYKNIEIEVHNENLFIKTTDQLTKKSFEALLKVVENKFN